MVKETSITCVGFRDSITNYLEKALPATEKQAMEHHRQACESCEEFLGQIQLTIEALGALNRQRSAEHLSSNVLDAFREWKESAERGASWSSEALLEELLKKPVKEREFAVSSLSRFQSVDLGELAMREAARMGVEDPESAVNLAHLSVVILERVPASIPCDRRTKEDKLGQALTVLGNCQRICSDFLGAAETFLRAERALEKGTGEPQHRAHLLQVRAQYLADRGQLQHSLSDLDEAISIYRGAEERHNEGRVLIGKGRVLGFSGFVENAIPCLRSGLELINRRRDPRLVLVAKHNLVEYLSDCGFREEANRLLAETRELHEKLSNTVDLIRFKWLEGKIALDLEDMGAAEELLLQVKSYFVENEMAHDVAVVSLDLAMVYLKQGRTAELKKLAGEMVTIFSGLGVRRELFAALAFFNKAKEIEQTTTMSLLQELIEVLEKARQRGAVRPQLSISN